MPSQRPPSVDRVEKALCDLGAQGRIRQLDDSARTAKEAAAALGVEVGQIASSLIFLSDGKPVLVVASGGHRVDEKLLGNLTGGTITKANADDVRAATGYAIGGVPPVGLATQIPTFVDEALAEYEEVWAAGGHSHWVYPTNFSELLRTTGGTAAVVGA